MSRRQQIQQRVHSLSEINSIMGAMKNLSLFETRKLTRILDHQQRLLTSIDKAVADFLHFYPQPVLRPTRELVLLIGSERGFCGNFNEELIEAMNGSNSESRFLIIGNRLASKLADDPRIEAVVDGPSVSEEVPPALFRLMEWLSRPDAVAGRALTALSHDAEGGVNVRRLLPMPPPPEVSGYADPPLLQLPDATFYKKLLEHYLFAALHQLFYSSLMAENRRRLMHMEGAIQQMERSIGEATLKYNALRQEEITEEIEIIMLSAEALLETEPIHGGMPQLY